ncbi:hypothetical protein, partial [Pseudomonas sp. NFACC07-1]
KSTKAQKHKSTKAQKHPGRSTDLLLKLKLIRGIPLTHAVPNSRGGSLLAKASVHSYQCQQTHRHREQARSHKVLRCNQTIGNKKRRLAFPGRAAFFYAWRG